MTQLSKVKQNIHQHKDKSCNLIKHKKTNSRPNWAVWTVFVKCAHWRGSTLAVYKTVLIIFPLNLQTITITLDVVRWRWGGHGGEWASNLTPSDTTWALSCKIWSRQHDKLFHSTPISCAQCNCNQYTPSTAQNWLLEQNTGQTNYS